MTNQKGFAERLDIWLMIVSDLFVVMCLILMGWLSLVIFNPAEASVFADVGQSTYQKPVNGIYWQDGHPYSEDSKGLYVRIGYDYAPTSWFSVAGSAFSLGKYELDAQATPLDPQYNPNTPNYCNGPCPPLNRWLTRGSVYGVSLTAKVQYKGAFLEAGPTYNYQNLSLNVWDAEGSALPGYQVFNLNGTSMGYTVGVGFEYGNFRVGLVMYQFDIDYKDDKFSDPEYIMPGGVTNAYAGYVGWRF